MAMSWIDRKSEYEAIARKIDPSAKLVTKDAWPWKVLAVLVTAVTFGGMTYRRFLDDYATTIGPIQGYPRQWPILSARIIVHEARHTQQARWCGLWIHPWVGLPLFGLLYIAVFLPIGFAFFRWRFEIDAELASYRYQLRHKTPPSEIRARAKRFGPVVCGGDYGWSWIIGGVAGFESAAEKAIQEAASRR